MKIYRVKNWDKNFENNKSRERDQCSFVCIPNKQDGLGLIRILMEKDGPAIYGIWHLIVGALSRQHKPRDGWMTDDGHQTGTAWAPDCLALRWRRKPEEIQRALEVLSSEPIGWLEVINEVPAECPSTARVVPAECPTSALKEGRKEEKEPNGIFEELLTKWNQNDGLIKIRDFTEKRKKALNERLKDVFFSENWVNALRKISESDFCTGKNDRGWKADVDWFLRPDSVAKIMEGKYDNRGSFQRKQDIQLNTFPELQ